MDTRVAYGGQKVFVGIDVHKRQYTVNCRTGGFTVKKFTCPGEPEALVTTFKRYFDGAEIYSAYEAGFSGFVLHRYLIAVGIVNIVVHAASIEVNRKRSKTDKRDAAKIAEQLEVGRLKGIRVPSPEEELSRVITRTREQYVQMHTRLLVQIRSKLNQFGILRSDDNRRMSVRRITEELVRLEGQPELRFVLEHALESLTSTRSILAKFEKEIRRRAADDPLQKVYRQIPGIGPISSRVLAHELGDMSQFQNERQLFSFLGLVPSEFTTDDDRRLGHITRQGRALLRHTLVELAWRAIKKDSALAAVFERIASHKGKKRAIIAVARKLAGRARALFQSGGEYQVNYAVAA